jgi:DNA-binding transcriptional LysR family regulator
LPALERGLLDLQSALEPEPVFEPSRAKLTFSIGMADYMQAVLMAPLLSRLASSAPFVDLNVPSFPDLPQQIEAGRIDLALSVPGDELRTHSREPAFDDEFVCLVRRDHPVVKKKLSLSQYVALAHVVVAPSGTPGSMVDTELEKRGLQRRIALRVSKFLIAPQVVSETDFISTMPARLAHRVAARYGLRLLPPPLPLPNFGFTMSWHSRLDHDPAHRWLRELCASVCGSL